jgi:CRP-like cAMP-binding protein
MTPIEHFKSFVQLFVQPDENQFSAFMAVVKEEQFEKGDILLSAGSICPKVWFVHEGILRHFFAESGKEGTVWFSFPGDLLTEVQSFVMQQPSTHNIIAVTPCTLLGISYADLQHFYQTEPVWERFGRLTTEQYLIALMNRSYNLLFRNGYQKYHDFLEAHPEASQHIPLHQIADFIGVKFETLSRIRGKRKKV